MQVLKRADVPLLESSFKAFQVQFYQNFLDTLTANCSKNQLKHMFLVVLSRGKKVVLPFLSILPGRVDSSGVSSFRNLLCKKISHQGEREIHSEARLAGPQIVMIFDIMNPSPNTGP